MTDSEIDPAAAVAVLGVGALGGALARAFLKVGHATTVWNRTAARADALVDLGATRASTPADAVDAASLVVLSVSTDEDARAVSRR